MGTRHSTQIWFLPGGSRSNLANWHKHGPRQVAFVGRMPEGGSQCQEEGEHWEAFRPCAGWTQGQEMQG